MKDGHNLMSNEGEFLKAGNCWKSLCKKETCTKNVKCTHSAWFLERPQWKSGQHLRYLQCYLVEEYRVFRGRWSGLFKRTLMDILEYLCRRGLENVLTARRDQEIDFLFLKCFSFFWKVNTMFIWDNRRWGGGDGDYGETKVIFWPNNGPG